MSTAPSTEVHQKLVEKRASLEEVQEKRQTIENAAQKREEELREAEVSADLEEGVDIDAVRQAAEKAQEQAKTLQDQQAALQKTVKDLEERLEEQQAEEAEQELENYQQRIERLTHQMSDHLAAASKVNEELHKVWLQARTHARKNQLQPPARTTWRALGTGDYARRYRLRTWQKRVSGSGHSDIVK